MKLTKTKLQQIIQEELAKVVKEYGAPVFSPKKEKSQYARKMPVADEDDLDEKKKWMQDIKSTGECTPYTKPGCKGKAKAFAKRAQKGDVRDDNLKKGKNPHGPG